MVLNKNTFVFLFFVVIILILHFLRKNKEGFYSNYGNYKSYCADCGWRNRNRCSECINCGWCIKDNGVGGCVAGDHNGATGGECKYWEYGDPYYYYNSKDLMIPEYKDIYPNYRYNLRKGRWDWRGRVKSWNSIYPSRIGKRLF